MALFNRFAKAFNVFIRNEETPPTNYYYPAATYSSTVPHTPRRRFSSERSIISSIYNRICVDVAGIDIRHILVDEVGNYKEDLNSSINWRMNFEPNMDQGPRAFRQDIVQTLFDKGCAAIVPVDYMTTPATEKVVDYLSFRVGEICQWYPYDVRLNVYNESKGLREEITLPKKFVAIVENPLYAVINEPSSTLQRLIRKLGLLDEVDEATSSRRLDLIIQLPYVVKSEARKAQAEARRQEIEFQLKQSQYGIAYTDGTEKITQLNRPAENNLLKQIEYLQETLYDQLGITKEVMSGTADEKTMLTYMDRTIEPILDAITEAMQRSFVGQVAANRGERIDYFKDPFKLVPLSEIAIVADKFSRNEILAANEIRSKLGIRPHTDPKADKLQNSNMPLPVDDSEISENSE